MSDESNGIVRTVHPLRSGEKLRALFTMAMLGRVAGLTGRPFRMQPKRWLGHRVTVWRKSPETDRLVIAGHVRY